MTPRTPAGRLVAAFGDVETMAALYAPQVEWSLPPSAPFPRPIKGRETVIAFNREVWTKYYRPDCTVEIFDEVGDERVSAVRFVYRAHMIANGRTYENEYILLAHSEPEGITQIFEAFDTARAAQIGRSEV